MRRAATVLLLRDASASGGVEVLMVQRHRRSGFLPSAWVFPGGVVDATDALHGHASVRGGDAIAARMGLSRADAVPWLVAGARETFEESGCWLGQGSVPAAHRAPLAAGELALDALLHAERATLELDRLALWSWWVTPAAEPRRYDTRFFVTELRGEQAREALCHDARETVATRWVAPTEALLSRQQDFPLAPPTWWTLVELARATRDSATRDSAAAEVIASAASRVVAPIEPVMRFDEAGMTLLLPGDGEHPAPSIPGVVSRITHERGQWVAWQGARRLTLAELGVTSV